METQRPLHEQVIQKYPHPSRIDAYAWA